MQRQHHFFQIRTNKEEDGGEARPWGWLMCCDIVLDGNNVKTLATLECVRNYCSATYICIDLAYDYKIGAESDCLDNIFKYIFVLYKVLISN